MADVDQQHLPYRIVAVHTKHYQVAGRFNMEHGTSNESAASALHVRGTCSMQRGTCTYTETIFVLKRLRSHHY